VGSLYNKSIEPNFVQIQKTRKDFKGDITIVVFPLLKFSGKGPEQTANDLGNYLVQHFELVEGFNVIKGFLNIEISKQYWFSFLEDIYLTKGLEGGQLFHTSSPKKIMVEYSSPNTNKPLHLGHIRNNLLGYAVANILKATGNEVLKVNLINDRGIHICKSMLAWQKFGNGATPESTGIKGDHLVGDYYVRFDQEYKAQTKELMSQGMTEEEAKKQAPILLEAQEMLRKWEAGEEEVLSVWRMMNQWVYNGFDETYKRLGVDFDRLYYESQTYLLGKQIVLDALTKGLLYKKEDGSVWADLTEKGLDHKVLLRSDGTSVYMTQDIGTAHQRFEQYHIDSHIYVVGNEQNYHFQALAIVLGKMGFDWADKIFHLSYGMVELPEGKMKSREGTVVDADDLMDEMISTARQMSEELGKLEGLSAEDINKTLNIIGLGALKYFILKVDPKKNMVFDPKESIDFNGNTGPFIQYTYARIKSILRKAADAQIVFDLKQASAVNMGDKEKELVKLLYDFPMVVQEAAKEFSPAIIANYCYDLAKEYNQFYHDCPILKEADIAVKSLRFALSQQVSQAIGYGMKLLGIDVPERM
ncbi:MAG TPA: arginine--tRNA ligase, partial [Bacteroidales bacterium]